MSLYSEYLKERTNDQILEFDFGFVTFRHLDAETTYIVDIYVTPGLRKDGLATSMADEVSQIAKSLGKTKLLGSVMPSAKGSTDCLKVLLGYGMKLKSAVNDGIFFEKDI